MAKKEKANAVISQTHARDQRLFRSIEDLLGRQTCNHLNETCKITDKKGINTEISIALDARMENFDRERLRQALDAIEKKYSLKDVKAEYTSRIQNIALADHLDTSDSKAFAEQIAKMSPKQRKEALAVYYPSASRRSWSVCRTARPTFQDMIDWLDASFHDRREIGLFLGDMQHLDHAAYQRIKGWTQPLADGSKRQTPDLGLPSKAKAYDWRSASAPSSAEVKASYVRGDPDAPHLERAHYRAQYHIKKNNQKNG